MEGLWKKLADWFYSYGEKHAGMKSIRGSFEGKVPEKLKKHETEKTKALGSRTDDLPVNP